MKYLLEVFIERKNNDFKNFIQRVYTVKLDEIIDEHSLSKSIIIDKLEELKKDTKKIILKYFEITEKVVNRESILDHSVYTFKTTKKVSENPVFTIELDKNLKNIDNSKDILIEGIYIFAERYGWNDNDFTNQIISDIICEEDLDKVLKYFPKEENLKNILKNNNILVTNCIESSGSHYYSYKNTVKKENGKYYININVNIPTIVTDDMSSNILFIVIPKEISLINVRVNLIDNYL